VTQSLLVVGSIAFDTVRTPFGEAPEVLGGSATYFSVAASFFTPVRLVGVVGDDFPPSFLDTFSRRRIDTAGLQVVQGGKTFRWKGSYEGAMNEARTDDVQLNVFGGFKPDIPQAFRQSDLVFLANGSPVTQASVLDQVKKPRLVVADTMNFYIETQRDALLALLKRVDGLVMNDGEARMLTGKSNLIEAAEQVLAQGPSFVVVKKGEHGAILVSRPKEGGEPRLCALPAYPNRQVKDPTGAGDSFAGGMMGSLARAGRYEFHDLVRAMACGTVIASFEIEDFSLRRFDRLTQAEIDARLAAYAEMLAIGKAD